MKQKSEEENRLRRLYIFIQKPAVCRKGRVAGRVTPPTTTTLFPSSSVDNSFDVNLILLGVSFMMKGSTIGVLQKFWRNNAAFECRRFFPFPLIFIRSLEGKFWYRKAYFSLQGDCGSVPALIPSLPICSHMAYNWLEFEPSTEVLTLLMCRQWFSFIHHSVSDECSNFL